jgi:OOP family OmpA-OmpF porin
LAVGVAGALVVSIVTILLGPNSASNLEDRIEASANAALVKAGFSYWRASARGQAIELEGVAPSEEAMLLAIAAVRSAPGVTKVRATDVTVIPEVSPFRWTATRRDDRVVLEGVAPDRRSANAIHAAAVRLFESDMSDMTTLAAGAPAGVDWSAAAIVGLESLRRMKEGTARLEDGELVVSGIPKGETEASQIHALMRTPGDGVSAFVELMGPPEWIARVEGGRVVMEGKAPSISVQRALQRAAGGVHRAEDKTVVASTGDWHSRARAALPLFAEFDSGEMVVQGRVFRIAGRAPSSALSFLRDEMNQIDDAFTVVFDVDKVPPDLSEIAGIDLFSTGDRKVTACERALNRVAGGGRIAFTRGSSEINRTSGEALDKLVAVAEACSDLRLEIQGHTDSSGGRETNLRLSRGRADAVRDYLVAQGLSPARLVAIGFGADRPVASNRTDAGRARNRRIEYRVIRGEAD